MSAKIQLVAKKPDSAQADVLVALVDSPAANNSTVQALDRLLGGGLVKHLGAVDFQWEKGAVLPVACLGKGGASHVVLAGVRAVDGGDGARFAQDARLSAAVAAGVRAAMGLRAASVAVLPGSGKDLVAIAQGAALGAYKFTKYVSSKKGEPELKQVQVCVPKLSPSDKKDFARGLSQAEGVCLARDLVNEPPNILTPEEFARRAKAVAKKHQLTAKVLDHKGIVKAGMNLHYAVGKGSDNLPYFIHLTYKPTRPKGKVVFVGKGVTFDSGGLCIKPGPSMLDMKTDMAGAGAVLGLMEAVGALKPDVEVHGIIGAAENMPDAKSYRPSDVIESMSGKGVEVINTDAEGRMVLADALHYATKLSPDFIVDAATLTGATLVSLGAPYSAFYTGSDGIADAMKSAAAEAGESFWHMPLIEELVAQLKSDVTDLKHTGDRFGGAITAALFLREFTGGVPWMHCDIPGPVYRDRPSGMHPKGATGHAVLTFLKLIEMHGKEAIVSKKKSKAPALTSVSRPKKSQKKSAKKSNRRRSPVRRVS